MTKPIIIADLAYKSPRRTGRGTGHQGLRATLKYLQFRDRRNNHLARTHGVERWRDRGLGIHHGDIYRGCDALQSPHVLAWTWVISPAPDVLALVPERDRRALLDELTERVVEDYYAARGLDAPEYSYVLHNARTKSSGETQEHLHTHVVLPGTVPTAAERLPFYNNARQGHDRLFRDIAARDFVDLLDARGIDWRRLREPDVQREPDGTIDLDDFFSR
ncbi:MAG: hypothetical protein SF123_12200 [Chloroflexota bacterium]|nr:hypothetical protein [Chloroflexota bacterium]